LRGGQLVYLPESGLAALGAFSPPKAFLKKEAIFQWFNGEGGGGRRGRIRREERKGHERQKNGWVLGLDGIQCGELT
jgi:hypothetical protein